VRAGRQDTGPLAQRIHQHLQMARRATRCGLAAFALLAAQLGMVEGGFVHCVPVSAVRVLLHVCARGELRGRAGSRDGGRDGVGTNAVLCFLGAD
jgi:hypothetical protein